MSQGFRIAYTPQSELAKLSELRAKTDRQLQSLVRSKLDVGLSFAAEAQSELSAGRPAHGQGSLQRANQALAEAQRLFPALNEEHRLAFAPRINEFRQALNHLAQQIVQTTFR